MVALIATRRRARVLSAKRGMANIEYVVHVVSVSAVSDFVVVVVVVVVVVCCFFVVLTSIVGH